MFSKNLNWKIYFFISLFSFVIIFGTRACIMLLTGQVVFEDGTPAWSFIAYLLIIVLLSYLASVLCMLKQLLKFKSKAFTVDEDGIHNTLIYINILAFVFTFKIKFIPWDSVKYFDQTTPEFYYIRVNTRKITASRIAKLVIAVLGYSFAAGFTKGNLSDEERRIISNYISEKSPDCENADDIL